MIGINLRKISTTKQEELYSNKLLDLSVIKIVNKNYPFGNISKTFTPENNPLFLKVIQL